MPIPIFILSFNRLEVLKTAIESYLGLHPTPTLIIHDSGSTYAPLLDYLHEIELSGAIIYRNRPSVRVADDLNSVVDTIEEFCARYGQSNYVVTDPDIALCDKCPDALDLFAHVLAGFPNIDVVGPMLRIDDIPDHYPLKSLVIKRHSKQMWHKMPEMLCWRGTPVSYQHTYIDTTFGMYRAGFRFSRFRRNAIRTYAPYWARHLDWYIDPAHMSDDQRAYLASSSNVSHWSGAWLRDALAPGFDTEDYDPIV